MFAHVLEFGKIKSYSMVTSVNTNWGHKRQEYGLASAKNDQHCQRQCHHHCRSHLLELLNVNFLKNLTAGQTHTCNHISHNVDGVMYNVVDLNQDPK